MLGRDWARFPASRLATSIARFAENIEVIRSGKVRRAKLYYLREKKGKKATRIKEKTRKVKVEAPSAQ